MSKAFLIASLLVLSSTLANADDAESWIGEQVFYKEGARAQAKGKNIELGLVPFPAIVEDVDGDLLWSVWFAS